MKDKKLTMAVRMAIIPEISKQNYDTLAKQFREVVANSFDAQATEIQIKVSHIGFGPSAKTQLVLEDNGFGMTADEFKADYLGVGGSPKAGDPETIGRIGIGSLAVAVLCSRMTVETRKKGTDEVVVADLWIGQAVKGVDRLEEVQEVEVGRIREIRPAKVGDPPHFTRLTLHEVYDDTSKILNDKERFGRVVQELRRTLPLPYPIEHPLLKKFNADLREVLEDKERLPTIDVFIRAPCLGDGPLQLDRYAHGHMSQDEEHIEGYPRPIMPMVVKEGKPKLTIFGYLVDAGSQLPEGRRGIVVRVKNMGVELHTFFESGDSAANVRITGEVFIENLADDAMTINRNELVKEHPDYIAIQKVMQEELRKFAKEVRGRVDINSRIKKEVDKARGVRNACNQVGHAIEESGIDPTSLEQDEGVLANAEDVDVEQEIRDLSDSIVVYTVDSIEKAHAVQHIDDEVEVTLNSDLFDNTITIGVD